MKVAWLSLGLIIAAIFFAHCPVYAADKTYSLPCEALDVVPSGDGTTIWFTCSKEWSDWKRAVEQARRSGKPEPPPKGADYRSTDLYTLDLATGRTVLAAHSPGAPSIIPAPHENRALVVFPAEHSWGTAYLYEKEKRLAELPLNAYFLLWSADGKLVYSYGGSTVEADAWNILGIFDLSAGKLLKKTLKEPTEIVRVCAATGHVFTATPVYPGSPASTIEYDREVNFVRRVTKWEGARFSATCKYVASESDFHGPLPWSVFETATGKRLYRFDYCEDDKDSYGLTAWNPKVDRLMIREYVAKGAAWDHAPNQVFDVATGRVREILPKAEAYAWSADGRSVILGRGRTLVFHAIQAAEQVR